jgi:hypothetical protein
MPDEQVWRGSWFVFWGCFGEAVGSVVGGSVKLSLAARHLELAPV